MRWQWVLLLRRAFAPNDTEAPVWAQVAAGDDARRIGDASRGPRGHARKRMGSAFF